MGEVICLNDSSFNARRASSEVSSVCVRPLNVRPAVDDTAGVLMSSEMSLESRLAAEDEAAGNIGPSRKRAGAIAMFI